ncbi:hypothetical protein G5714_012285 [Onychostoma macrolepis]|uniref:Uncharacterized protein n=1 Tax=Onychostoma macrolepis TaxID=369639 RepID=A0A7J6CI91_9TELE|nr:hypothetical protein G5714_012285 [Onychostoma macrolepis]
MENTENAFEWLCIDTDLTFNRGNIRKRHFLSLAMRSRRGKKSKGDDVLEEYEATNTLSVMRRALLGHIPETWNLQLPALIHAMITTLLMKTGETYCKTDITTMVMMTPMMNGVAGIVCI